MGTNGEDAFVSFYNQHLADVKRYAATLVGRDSVEDVVSRTFETAWLRFDAIPPGHERGWLFTTCRYKADKQHWVDRRRAALAIAIASARPRIENRPTLNGYPIEAIADLQSMLARWRASDRTLFVLWFWYELTPTDIATMTGLNSGRVRKRIYDLRRRLDPVVRDVENTTSAPRQRSRPA